jgi:hypothetical protein
MKSASPTCLGAPTRRELLRSAGLFGGTLVLVRVLAACGVGGGGEQATGASDDALVACKPPVIGQNHGHKLVVSPADVAAGVEKTYSIQGAAGHDHFVTITSAQFTQLGAGNTIEVMSTNTAGHMHTVTITCSAPLLPSEEAGADADVGADVDAGTAACANGAQATAISRNHGHSLTVPKADVAAAAPKTYSIQGTASHDHQVSLAAADFASLKAGQSITVMSSLAFSHVHTVTVDCGTR